MTKRTGDKAMSLISRRTFTKMAITIGATAGYIKAATRRLDVFTLATEAPQVNPNYVYYLILFKPGPKWVQGKSVFEQPLRGHGEYLQKLFEEKKLIYAGPFLDDHGGLAILRVSGASEMHEIMAKEPGTQQHIFEAEVHPWYMAFDAAQGRSPFAAKEPSRVQ